MLLFISVVALVFTNGQCFGASPSIGLENFLLEESQEAILVLGNKGSGKSTIVTLLSGGELISIKKYGQFVIIDDNSRIANNSTTRTIFRSASGNSSAMICDFPGFLADARDEDGISAEYILNGILGRLKSVKFVFVASYQSIFDDEVFNNNFETLMRYATDILKNIKKYRNSTGLVVTKVDNSWNINDNGLASLANNDTTVLEAIREKLNRLKHAFENKNKDLSISSNDREYHDEAITFLNVLIGTNDTEETKMSIFRKPIQVELMNNLTSFKIDKNGIKTLVNEHLKFIRKETADSWHLSISNDFNSDKCLLVDKMFQKRLNADIVTIVNETKQFYLNSIRPRASGEK